MNFPTITQFLGLYFGEAQLAELLAGLRISDKPKLPKGDDTAYLSSKELGIEQTFRDERYLDVPPTRQYPEGALVLNNVRFYGPGSSSFKEFKGQLPEGLFFGQTFAQLQEQLGEPDWTSDDQDRARWDQEGYLIFATFSDEGGADTFAFQLPVDDE